MSMKANLKCQKCVSNPKRWMFFELVMFLFFLGKHTFCTTSGFCFGTLDTWSWTRICMPLKSSSDCCGSFRNVKCFAMMSWMCKQKIRSETAVESHSPLFIFIQSGIEIGNEITSRMRQWWACFNSFEELLYFCTITCSVNIRPGG